jgi:hypothetical protein
MQPLRLLTREGCELCEQMREELAELAARLSLPPVVVADVDDDPQWRRRYGLKIPVLLWGEEAIAVTRLDPAEILRLFRPR